MRAMHGAWALVSWLAHMALAWVRSPQSMACCTGSAVAAGSASTAAMRTKPSTWATLQGWVWEGERCERVPPAVSCLLL